MGIGMNFTCTCCNYDSGILMLNQGTKFPLKTVIQNYIDVYMYQIDVVMHAHQKYRYLQMLEKISRGFNQDITYNYFACVCYVCDKMYEMLDLLERKEEVYVGERGIKSNELNSISHIFSLPSSQWSSFFGDVELCLFCNQEVEKITQEKLMKGLSCPKCLGGQLTAGNEFEIWD